MQNICDKDKCTGCGLCAAKCPKSAISIEIVGLHYFPVINQEKCVDCGLCQKQCPSNNPIELNSVQSCFAAWSNDEYDHFESASGGMATAISKRFIQNGGYVAGCSWDNDFRATSVVTNKIEDLEKFRKSKYVHNYFSKETYHEILSLLKFGERVLFIGVPCQCEAIKKFVGIHNVNLLTINLLCRGAASPKLFEDYIAKFKKKNKNIGDITFRGGEFDCKFCVWDNQKNLVYKCGQYEDPYFYSFMRHTMYRKSCLTCSYAQDKRPGDLTIADFWGLDNKIIEQHNLKQGVNLVLLHTDKGKELLFMVKDDVTLIERPVQEAIAGNDTLKEPTPKPFQYDLLNKMFPIFGLKTSLYLFDVEFQRKKIKRLVRSMVPDFIVKIVKRCRK